MFTDSQKQEWLDSIDKERPHSEPATAVATSSQQNKPDSKTTTTMGRKKDSDDDEDFAAELNDSIDELVDGTPEKKSFSFKVCMYLRCCVCVSG